MRRFDPDHPFSAEAICPDTITCTDPLQERLLDALLRRGYLIEPVDQRNLIFAADSHPDDPEDVRKLLDPTGAILAPGDSGGLVIYGPDGQEFLRLRATEEDVEKAVRRLTEDRQRIRVRGVTGFDRYGLKFSLERFGSPKAFWNMSYLPCVPVAALDPGVALLVKVMPRYGIGTAMSCEGHDWGRETPEGRSYRQAEIVFLSRIHANWAETVLRCALGGDLEKARMTFPDRNRDHFLSLAKKTPEEHLETMEMLYRLARRLLNPDFLREMRLLREKLREDRHDILCPEITADRWLHDRYRFR